MKSWAIIALTALAGIGTGVLGGVGHAQGIPPVPTGTTGTQTSPPPPAPPVVAPGPLGDATTHGSADAARRGAVASDGLKPPLQSLWRQDFDARVSEVVAGDGRAYALAGNHVTALDLATGTRLWTSAVQMSGELAFGGGKVIAGGGQAIALDAATGAVAWTSSKPVGSEPLIAGDLVIVPDIGLTAFDLATGAQRWHHVDNSGTIGTPAAAGDRIYQESGSCSVVAVDRRDGHVIWTRNRGCGAGGRGHIALEGDRLYPDLGQVPLAASDGSDVAGATADILAGNIGVQREGSDISVVDLAAGRLLWSAKGPSISSDALVSPLVDGDWLFRTRFTGTVEARALATGAVAWQGRLRPAKSTFTGSTADEATALAAGPGVLLVVRGSTLDALGAATAPPSSLQVKVPGIGARLIEAGAAQTVTGSVTGNLWPASVAVEVDPYPFDRFVPSGKPGAADQKGVVSLSLKTDRNTRVRLVGAGGSTQPTAGYVLYAYPRIRLFPRQVGSRIRTTITVSGSRVLRFRGRRVHLYLDRRSRHRMTRLASATLRGPSRRTGRAVVRFRLPRRVGSRDSLFACIPGVELHGQGAPDPLQTRCGQRTIKY